MMDGSMLHYSSHAFTDNSKRKAVDTNNPAVINVDDCLDCNVFSETGTACKRSVRHDSPKILCGQMVYSDDRFEAETKANGSKRGFIKESSSHTPPKMQNEEEQKEAFKSLLALEIKRQVLDGLGEAGHSQLQDLQVVEIEDIVSSVGVSVSANTEEKNKSNHPRPYIVKVKLLVSVCIPIFLQTAPCKEQPIMDAWEEVEEKRTKFDDNFPSKGSPVCKSSQKPSEQLSSRADLRKPQSMFEEERGPLELIKTQDRAVEQKLSQVKYEKALCRIPLSENSRKLDHPVTFSSNIPEWRDRFDCEEDHLVVKDFEVHDFDADKTEDKFNEGQIWALYDDKDGMPRHYALITDVHSVRPFEVSITWLEPKTHSMEALMWLTSGVSITCGAFEPRNQQNPIKLTHVHHFSHAMRSQAGLNGEILISPSKGEVWALYKDQISLCYTSQRSGGKYELVQVVDDDRDSHTLTVVPLLKIGGFRTRFVQEQWPFKIARKDFFKFSHQIPAYILKEEPTIYLELDPASTPKLYK